MKLLKTIDDCRSFRREMAGKRLALVPTMGALHDAHMALVRLARRHADIVVVSIFVNPLQFGPHEDYQRYPRPLEADLAICEETGVDAVFAPGVETMYPGGQERLTRVVPPSDLTESLCGLARPGHFTGVATVVLKLFNIVQPDAAVFGEKDAQQFAILRRMVQDLNVPVETIGHPTVREESGLAISSRNSYLASGEDREAALFPSLLLRHICQMALDGNRDKAHVFKSAIAAARDSIPCNPEKFTLEYLEAVDRETFEPMTTLEPGRAKILIAGRVGSVRLIDNMDLDPCEAGVKASVY